MNSTSIGVLKNCFQEVRNITLIDTVLKLFADKAGTKKCLPDIVKLACSYCLTPLISSSAKRPFLSQIKSTHT